MAFNLKYRFSLTGNQSSATYYFKMYEDGFVGSARTFSSGWGPRNAITINTDISEQDPFFPIRPQVCSLNLFLNCLDDLGNPFTEADLTAIIFSDDETIKFELSKGVDLLLTGWFTPQQTTSWNAYLYGAITLTFTDGLAKLNGIDYIPFDSYAYAITNLRKTIMDCLDETNLDLNVRYSNTLYLGSDTDLLIDDLALEAVAFYQANGTTSISCADVLRLVMRSINCVLFQKDGEWRIESFTDKSQATEAFATILYATPEAALTLTNGTFTTDPLLSTNRLTTDRSMIVTAFKPKSKVNATANFSAHTHASVNYLFRDFTANVPDRWTISSGSIVTRQASAGFANGVDIQGYANNTVGFVDEYIRSVGYPVKKGAKILIGWRFNTLATSGIEQPQPRVQVRINDQLDFTGTAVNESLKEDSTWQSGIYWIQQGNTGTFTAEVTVENDGYLFMLIGRPYLSSPGVASQLTYYTSCEVYDVVILNARTDNELIDSNYKAVQQLVSTGKKYIFVDEQIDHAGHHQIETPYGAYVESDYYTTIYKNPGSRDDIPANIRSDETLLGGGTLLLQTARLRGMQYGSNFILIEVGLIGELVELFGIYTITILGSSRRMVCINIETNVKTETQSATFAQALLSAEADLTSGINFLS